MMDLWHSLSATAQDVGLFAALTLPILALGVGLTYGYAPLPLVRAMLWRFRWANGIFVLLIAISVGMGIGLLAQERGLRLGSAMAADKFDLVITAPGSELTMMLATVFLQPSNTPLLDGETYAEIANHPRVKTAAPLAFGDSYEGNPVVGTTAAFVEHLTDGAIDGQQFETTDEAVVGALVDLNIGDTFEPSHGVGDAVEGGHGFEISVVGRMPVTGSPWDRALIVPIEGVWETHGLANGHALEDTHLGAPFDPEYFPGTPSVIVQADSLAGTYLLQSQFTRDLETMAFFPGAVLSNLYRIMGDMRQAMSIMALVSQILVAISVLLGLFILSRLFARQLGLLRAIGAPRRFVLGVVWSYAATLLITGSLLGVALGLVASEVLGQIVSERTQISVPTGLGWTEVHLVAAFLSATSVLSLIPAFSALRGSILAAIRA
ncbi:FtsX-like permease family protein [Cognatishimia maritima]|uniref:Putative ABC transport system permease protein n=1 Tax=Cognatishimia maritima TaxID=870908 RepID=A0A1M5P2X8_9RHOB|nr:FtsX-like permease family protein [Cognatishimia maritima]SHG96184.1 putative ABC transport system permease protein [Cognatishimia maritima]